MDIGWPDGLSGHVLSRWAGFSTTDAGVNERSARIQSYDEQVGRDVIFCIDLSFPRRDNFEYKFRRKLSSVAIWSDTTKSLAMCLAVILSTEN